MITSYLDELQKITTPYCKGGILGYIHGLFRQMTHFLTDMSNRVEHQKRNQPAIEKWPFGFVFGVQLGLRQTRALIKTKKNKLLQVVQLWDK